MSSLDPILDFIAWHEAKGNYDVPSVHTRIQPSKPLTDMTVGEVLEWQLANREAGARSTAAGAFQVLYKTLADEVGKGRVTPDEFFTPDVQKRIAMSLLIKRGLREWETGHLSDDEFGTRLAKEWASLPVLHATYRKGRRIEAGQGYYGGVNGNPSNLQGRAVSFRAVLGGGRVSMATSSAGTDGVPGVDPTDPAGSDYAPGARGRYIQQSLPNEIDPVHLMPWVKPPIDLGSKGPPAAGGAPGAADERGQFGPPAPPPDVGIRGGRGSGPVLPGTWIDMFRASWADDYIVRKIEAENLAARYAWDLSFDPQKQARADGYNPREIVFFSQARSLDHYRAMEGELRGRRIERQKVDEWNGTGAVTLGGMTSPTALLSLAIPGAMGFSAWRSAGVNAVRSGLGVGLSVGGMEAVFETGRRQTDPDIMAAESVIRVGGAAIFAGALGAGAGALLGKAERNALISDLGREIAEAQGTVRMSENVDLGGDVKGKIVLGERFGGEVPAAARQRGVVIIGDEIRVDEARIVERFANGEHQTDAKTANELMEYEVGFAASVARRLKKAGLKARNFVLSERGSLGDTPEVFLRLNRETGELEITDPEGLARAIENGDYIEVGPALNSDARKHLKPLAIKATTFGDVAEAEAFLRAAHEAANKARDNDEFRRLIQAEITRITNTLNKLDDLEHPAYAAERERLEWEAEQDAIMALEEHRKENNRILTERRAAIVSRLLDGPFKRIHRNALSGELRDLVDKLAADGGLARMSDRTGLSVGPSVYSRGRTWDGIPWQLWKKSQTLYLRHLGFEDKLRRIGVKNEANWFTTMAADFRGRKADGTPGMSFREFREKASHAHITGERSDIPEINELADHLRQAWEEYRTVAEQYGVLEPRRNRTPLVNEMKRRIETMEKELVDPETGEVLKNPIRAMFEDMLKRMQKEWVAEPTEPYFTRIWNLRAIRDNREAFKERILKPFMGQNPEMEVWVSTRAGLQKEIDFLSTRPGNEKRIAELRARMKSAPSSKDEIRAMIASRRDKISEIIKERMAKGEKGTYSGPLLDEIKDLEYLLKVAPEGDGRWERVIASTDPADIEKRADDFLDDLMGEAEPDDLTTFRHPSRPTFGRRRQITVPNSILLKDGQKGNGIADFIETDFLLVHKIYADRMGPAIELGRTFARPADGISPWEGFEEALEDARKSEIKAWSKAGKSGKAKEKFDDHWAPMERDLRHLLDRVTNRIIRDPSRWDNRGATALRNWAALTFMGMSGANTVIELGKLSMEHGLRRVFRNAFVQLDEASRGARKAAVEEMGKAGAILDVAMGSALSRMAETGMDAITGTAPERWLRTYANRYFLWNGLAPLTTRLKEIDAAIRVHDTIDRMHRVTMLGKGASPDDLKELARYGISQEDAAEMMKEPVQLTDEGHWLANTDAWEDEGLVRKFRAAIRQGNENTVLMATAADKPVIVDGTVYIRRSPRVDKLAVQLGLTGTGDYWKMQSGLMTLPFTFWNYAMAAHTKILLAMLDEPSAQKLGGIAAMVGIGWLVAQARAPEGAWDRMDFDGKLARAIDQSGVMGVLLQYGYLGQGMSIGFTGQNLTPMDPRYGYRPSAADAAFNLMGAGPSVVRNAIEGAATLDPDTASWALPYRNFWLTKSFMDDVVDRLERRSSQ